MCKLYFVFYVLFFLTINTKCQMVHFGKCPQVETVKFFDIESFLGQWFIIERYPTWFENNGQCAYKHFEACGRRIGIEHSFVRDNIQFVLRWNSSYTPGHEAVFPIEDNEIDPVGVPIAVIATDYTEYALIYGCQENSMMNLKVTAAWILSRNISLSEETIHMLRMTLNMIPYTSHEYLERVYHDERNCYHYWTAYVEPPENIEK